MLLRTKRFRMVFLYAFDPVNSLLLKPKDMNVLVVLGTTSAYAYSVFAVLYGIRNPGFHGMRLLSVYHCWICSDIVTQFFDTTTMLIPVILLGKYFESLAKVPRRVFELDPLLTEI